MTAADPTPPSVDEVPRAARKVDAKAYEQAMARLQV
jgi:hypothetical protein